MSQSKLCTGKCGLKKLINEFGKMGKNRDGTIRRRAICKECRREKNRKPKKPKQTEKKCTGKCGKLLPLSSYHKRGTNKDGSISFRSQCKACTSDNDKARRSTPESRVKQATQAKIWRTKNTERHRFLNKRSRDKPENKAKAKIRNKEWSENNAEYKKQYNKQWREENRDLINARYRERYANDPKFRFQTQTRNRFGQALRRAGVTKKVNTKSTFGCKIEFLMSYIEEQFKPGMTWKNRGEIWHLDHRRPLVRFDLSKKFEQIRANDYSNLQPLYVNENLQKSAKWTDEQEKEYQLYWILRESILDKLPL